MVYISGGNQLLNSDFLLKKIDLREGMNIADLGCGGAGKFILPAARFIGPSGTAYAVDILKSVLSEVAKKARLEGIGNIKTIWANLEIYGSTQIPEGKLDRAFLINVLFQSKERENIFKESLRILKQNGKLLVVDWVSRFIPFGPPLVDRVQPEGVKLMARSLGFELIDEFDAGKYHFGLIFQKRENSI